MQMKLLRMTALNAAMLAGIAAIMSVPATERAEAAWCPELMQQYCVLSRDGVEYVAWTKTCFARRKAFASSIRACATAHRRSSIDVHGRG
jgi:hypothetical protein